MNLSEAMRLLEDAVPDEVGTWADLGSGDGTFTEALAHRLAPGSRIYAVDRDAAALRALARRELPRAIEVTAVVADFTSAFELPGRDHELLDGVLLANALHFARDAAAVLTRLSEMIRPGGRIVLVEYDRRTANPWVPHPLAAERLPGLATTAGLCEPRVTATMPSVFGGDLYVAVLGKSFKES